MDFRSSIAAGVGIDLIAFQPPAPPTDGVLRQQLERAIRESGLKAAMPVLQDAVEQGAAAPVVRAGVGLLVRRFGVQAVAAALKFAPGVGTAVEIGLFLKGDVAADGASAAARNRERNAHVKAGLSLLFSEDPAVSAEGARVLLAWGVSKPEIRSMLASGTVPEGYAFLVPGLATRPRSAGTPASRTADPETKASLPPVAPWRPPSPPQIPLGVADRKLPEPTPEQRRMQRQQDLQTQAALGQLPSQRAAVLDRGAVALQLRLDERIGELGVSDPAKADAGQLASALADLRGKLASLESAWASRSPTAEPIDLSLFGGAAFRLRPADLRTVIDGLRAVVSGLEREQGKVAAPKPEIQLPGGDATPGGQEAVRRREQDVDRKLQEGQQAYRVYERLLQRGRSPASALEEATRSLSPEARMAFDREMSRRASPAGGGGAPSATPGPSTERGNRLLRERGVPKTLEAAPTIAAVIIAVPLNEAADIAAALPREVRESKPVKRNLEILFPKPSAIRTRAETQLAEPSGRRTGLSSSDTFASQSTTPFPDSFQTRRRVKPRVTDAAPTPPAPLRWGNVSIEPAAIFEPSFLERIPKDGKSLQVTPELMATYEGGAKVFCLYMGKGIGMNTVSLQLGEDGKINRIRDLRDGPVAADLQSLVDAKVLRSDALQTLGVAPSEVIATRWRTDTLTRLQEGDLLALPPAADYAGRPEATPIVLQGQARIANADSPIEGLYSFGAKPCAVLVAVTRDDETGRVSKIGIAHVDAVTPESSIGTFINQMKQAGQRVELSLISGTDETALRIARAAEQLDAPIVFANIDLSAERADAVTVDRQGRLFYGENDNLSRRVDEGELKSTALIRQSGGQPLRIITDQ